MPFKKALKMTMLHTLKKKIWSTSLSKSLKLNLDEIAANRAKLTPLLPIKGCKPIGWGASVVM